MSNLIPIIVIVLCALLFLKVANKLFKILLVIGALAVLVVYYIPTFILT